MKKVWMVIPALGNGGAERILVYLASLIDKERFDCTVVILNGRSSVDPIYEPFVQDKSSKIRFLFLDKKRGFDVGTVIRLKRLIRKHQPDIIHTHLTSVLYVGLAVGRNSGIRCYHTVHNIAEEELPKSIRFACKRFYRSKLIRPIAIGQIVKDSLIEEYDLLPSEIPIIYNGIELSRYQVEPRNRDEKPFLIVNVAGFRPQKNHRLLIHAIADIPSDIDFRVHLLGDGELRKECEAEVKALGLTEKIIFEGSVENVPDYLAAANCFVLSSNYEGFPLVILEAMCAQLAIVSTKAGGASELVQDGVNGYLVETENKADLSLAIQKLMNNHQLAVEFGEKSLELSKQFDVTSMVRYYEDLFHRGHVS